MQEMTIYGNVQSIRNDVMLVRTCDLRRSGEGDR